MAKPTTTNPELRKIIEKLYRDNPEVGSGSTAAALRQELATGMPTKGTYHLQKAMDEMNTLAGWLKANPSASRADRLLAENLFLDLQEAVHSGYYADIRYEPVAPHSATPTGGPAGSPSGGGGRTPSGGGTVAELEKDLTDAVHTEEAVEGLGIGTAAAVTVGEGVISTLIANLALQAALEIILVAILPGQNEVYVEPKLIQEAFEPAIQKILAQLALRGVGEHPSGEFALLLERTKGGQSIYANALVGILPPVLRTGIPVTGQEVYEKKTEVRVLWVSLSTKSSATKEPLRLTIDGGEREGRLRVLSFRVYNPDAIATELLVKKPEVV